MAQIGKNKFKRAFMFVAFLKIFGSWAECISDGPLVLSLVDVCGRLNLTARCQYFLYNVPLTHPDSTLLTACFQT